MENERDAHKNKKIEEKLAEILKDRAYLAKLPMSLQLLIAEKRLKEDQKK
jgi:hypothetical protein